MWLDGRYAQITSTDYEYGQSINAIVDHVVAKVNPGQIRAMSRKDTW